jgi:hypothetical protein
MADATRLRNSGLTRAVPRMTLDTVPIDTAARLATSRIVGMQSILTISMFKMYFENFQSVWQNWLS